VNLIDESGLECGGADRPYCQALKITEPYRRANAQQMLGLRLDVPGSSGLLHEGDVLTLDISFPTYDSYLHVSYLDRSGRVGHVIPGNQQLWPAGAAHYVQETLYEIAEPYGIEAILAIATEQPLFPSARPRFEQTSTYLNALRQALTNLNADHPDTRIAANLLLVRTAPRVAATSDPVRGYAALARDSDMANDRAHTEG
jgi:hypothetical protein